MKTEKITEIALLLYPGCQMAAIYGLTDLFRIANEWAAYPHEDNRHSRIRVTHWQLDPMLGSIECCWDSETAQAHY
ncbi:MAG: GlxA family transcriptional regulator, partial [Anaerolineales bacterium]